MVPPVLQAAFTLRLEDCWAKTWAAGPRQGFPALSVRDHCINVGAVAEVLQPLLPATVSRLLPKDSSLLVAAHDIGKITPGFLAKCVFWQNPDSRPPVSGESDHAKISQWFLAGLKELQNKQGRPTDWLLAAGGTTDIIHALLPLSLLHPTNFQHLAGHCGCERNCGRN